MRRNDRNLIFVYCEDDSPSEQNRQSARRKHVRVQRGAGARKGPHVDLSLCVRCNDHRRAAKFLRRNEGTWAREGDRNAGLECASFRGER